MATKNNPGAYDCYANAHPDEPLFVLRSTDELAPHLVRAWAEARLGHSDAARHHIMLAAGASDQKPPMKVDKYREAMKCADNMEAWRIAQSSIAPTSNGVFDGDDLG